jgi:hypothetical protein
LLSFKAELVNSTIVFITVAIALPVIALTAWIWVIIERVDKEFRAELEGIHFDN